MEVLVLEVIGSTVAVVCGSGLAARAAIARRVARGPRLSVLIRRLPKPHRRAARKIAQLARECVERHPDASLESYTARETLERYLPETIAGYLTLPRSRRDSPQPDGRTPDDEMKRQLRTLRMALEQIVDADAAAAAGRMAVNGAFLGERFGPPPPSSRADSAASAVRIAVGLVEQYVRRRR